MDYRDIHAVYCRAGAYNHQLKSQELGGGRGYDRPPLPFSINVFFPSKRWSLLLFPPTRSQIPVVWPRPSCPAHILTICLRPPPHVYLPLWPVTIAIVDVVVAVPISDRVARVARRASTSSRHNLFTIGVLSTKFARKELMSLPVLLQLESLSSTMSVVTDSLGKNLGRSVHGSGTTNPSGLLWHVMEILMDRAPINVDLSYRAVSPSLFPHLHCCSSAVLQLLASLEPFTDRSCQ